MWLLVQSENENETVGCISDEDFQQLPDKYKKLLKENCSDIQKSQEELIFSFLNYEIADQVSQQITKYEKNKYRSESRALNLHLLSSGIYKQEDIEQLFEIQQGRCYYTGKELVKKPKNYTIDHIIPVTKGGSSWPSNLALTLASVNREKHNHSKRKYFSILEKRYGKEWRVKQSEFCKKVNSDRRAVDKVRKKQVSNHLQDFESKLKESFPRVDINYSLEDGDVGLMVDDIGIYFPAGFIRQKKFYSFEYILKITQAVVGKYT